MPPHPRFFLSSPLCAFPDALLSPSPPPLLLLFSGVGEPRNVPECGTEEGRRERPVKANAPRGARVPPSGIAGTTRGKGDGPGSRPPTPAGPAAAMRRTPNTYDQPRPSRPHTRKHSTPSVSRGAAGRLGRGGPAADETQRGGSRNRNPPTGIGNRRTGSETTPKGRPGWRETDAGGPGEKAEGRRLKRAAEEATRGGTRHTGGGGRTDDHQPARRGGAAPSDGRPANARIREPCRNPSAERPLGAPAVPHDPRRERAGRTRLQRTTQTTDGRGAVSLPSRGQGPPHATPHHRESRGREALQLSLTHRTAPRGPRRPPVVRARQPHEGVRQHGRVGRPGRDRRRARRGTTRQNESQPAAGATGTAPGRRLPRAERHTPLHNQRTAGPTR